MLCMLTSLWELASVLLNNLVLSDGVKMQSQTISTHSSTTSCRSIPSFKVVKFTSREKVSLATTFQILRELSNLEMIHGST